MQNDVGLETNGVEMTRLSVRTSEISVHKNGIEFRTTTPVGVWREMTVDLVSPDDGKRVHCTGVVVSCAGNRHTGYVVSFVFTHISRQSQQLLQSLSASRLR